MPAMQRPAFTAVLPAGPRHLAHRFPCRRSAAAQAPSTPQNEVDAVTGPSSGSSSPQTEVDVVVIGSGIGGLSCAALLARAGLSVTVCESHSRPGGAAHTFTKDGYHFESGPSLYSGMAGRGPGANPLALVLHAIDEPLELLTYNEWNVILPETPNGYPAGVGPAGFDGLVETAAGVDVLPQLRALQKAVAPLAAAATALPPAAIRLDPGVLISGVARYFSALAPSLPVLTRLTAPFSKVLDAAGVTNPFLRSYIDLLCFLLSGLPADGTITAEVAFMMKEWFDPNAALEFPKGGSQALVEALVRGVTKRRPADGSTNAVRLGAHVDEIVVENGRAVGVKLRNGEVLRARRAVVSNAPTPATLRMLGDAHAPEEWITASNAAPLNPSFMHLHLGFDATGLEGLGMHHIVVRDWGAPGGVTAPHNVVLVSIASVIDPDLAPTGKHCLHAYYPATEPWEPWAGLRRGTSEYEALKKERAAALWEAVERVIPDIRTRVEVEMVGSPLTHARYLRRDCGSYGPAWRAGEGVFPFGKSPVEGLLCCGDYVFPGIGLPAVAASGAIAANTAVPLWEHLALLEAMGL